MFISKVNQWLSCNNIIKLVFQIEIFQWKYLKSVNSEGLAIYNISV